MIITKMHKFYVVGILLVLVGLTSADSYIHGNGQLIARINETNVTYYHSDHLRSTSVITNEAGGLISQEQKYLPFGQEFPQEWNSNRFRFTGKEFDSDVGLNYFGARYYDPNSGRFLTVDPVKDGMSWYGYVEGNPLTRIDPTGTTSFALFVWPPEEELSGGIYPPQTKKAGPWLRIKRRVLYNIATHSNEPHRTKREIFLGVLNSLNPGYKPKYTGSLIEGIDLIGYRLGRKPLNLPRSDEAGSFSINNYVKEKPLSDEKVWPTDLLKSIMDLGEGESYGELYLTHISHDDGSFKDIREKPEKVTMPFHLGLYEYWIKREGDEFNTNIRDEWDFHGSKQARKLEEACKNPLILKYRGSIKVKEVENELERRGVKVQ